METNINGLIPMDMPPTTKTNRTDNNEISAYASESIGQRSICDVCPCRRQTMLQSFYSCILCEIKSFALIQPKSHAYCVGIVHSCVHNICFDTQSISKQDQYYSNPFKYDLSSEHNIVQVVRMKNPPRKPKPIRVIALHNEKCF